MNRQEIMDFINEIEEKYPVDEWMVEDIHVWPLIRIRLAFGLYNVETNLDIKRRNNLLLKVKRIVLDLFTGLKAKIKDRKNNDNWKREADILFLSNSSCRTQIYDGWYDRYCGPFIDNFEKKGYSTILYEATGNYEYRLPRLNKSLFIQNSLDYIKIKSFIQAKKGLNFNYKLDKLKDFDILLAKKINKFDINLIYSQVKRIIELGKFFEYILLKNKPKIVFIECYYSEIGMSLNLACSRLGIPSVDIQHGVQGDYHVAYGRWSNVPDGGYELLPDIFWCWSEDEKRTIENWNANCSDYHRPIVGGNLWLNMWLDNESPVVKEYNQILYKQMNKVEGQKNILYTLQGGYDPPEWLFEYINNSPKNWKWWIRLHHNMMSDLVRIKNIFSICTLATIDIENATNLPLLSLLYYIDVHITQFSSVVIEAAHFGVPSIILHKNGELSYKEYINNGIAKYIKDKEEFKKSLWIYFEKSYRKSNIVDKDINKILRDILINKEN